MNGRTLMLFAVAIMIAVAAVVIVKNRMSGGAEGTKILVATANIDTGTFVRADRQLAWQDWQGELSPSFIASTNFKIEDFDGAVARQQILAGTPLTTVSVVRVKEGGFMSAVLTPGKRAVSIAVSPTSGNAGFVFPGDHVDLILTHRIPVKDGGADVLASETFIQDARVLAVDQMLNNPDNVAVVAKTLTLEVTPKQAEMVNVATNLGSISVSLRSLASAKSAEAQNAPAEAGKDATNTDAAKVGEGQNPSQPQGNFSTDTDVSKLMGDKSAVRAKVNVYHGTTSEQIDFHQGKQ